MVHIPTGRLRGVHSPTVNELFRPQLPEYSSPECSSRADSPRLASPRIGSPRQLGSITPPHAAAGGEFAAYPWAWSWAPGSVGGEAPLWNEAALWQDFSLDPLVVETREASMYS